MVSVTTPGADSVQSSSPPGALLEDNERLALRDRLPFFAADLLHDSGVLGFDWHLHLHRFQDHHRVALFDGIPALDLDLPDGPRDMSLDLGQSDSSDSRGMGPQHPGAGGR